MQPCCPEHLWEKTSVASPIYFVSFLVLTNFILFNVIVGIVLDNFATYGISISEPISESDLEEFERVWYEFDITRTRFMHIFVRRLEWYIK